MVHPKSEETLSGKPLHRAQEDQMPEEMKACSTLYLEINQIHFPWSLSGKSTRSNLLWTKRWSSPPIPTSTSGKMLTPAWPDTSPLSMIHTRPSRDLPPCCTYLPRNPCRLPIPWWSCKCLMWWTHKKSRQQSLAPTINGPIQAEPKNTLNNNSKTCYARRAVGQ
jgi:hypothetical protein